MDLNQIISIKNKLNQINEKHVEKRLKKVIRDDFDTEVLDYVSANWKKGFKGNGELIGGYRNAAYEAMKEAMNPTAGGNVDLIYTGSFSSALFMPQDENIISVDSSDSKRDKLVSWYGDDIFDISNDQEKSIIDDAKQEVYSDILKYIMK